MSSSTVSKLLVPPRLAALDSRCALGIGDDRRLVSPSPMRSLSASIGAVAAADELGVGERFDRK